RTRAANRSGAAATLPPDASRGSAAPLCRYRRTSDYACASPVRAPAPRSQIFEDAASPPRRQTSASRPPGHASASPDQASIPDDTSPPAAPQGLAALGHLRSAGQHRRPLANPPLQDRQRHRAFAQHFVELLDVELRPKRSFRFVPGVHPGTVADLVAARLTHQRAIALDLALRARPGVTGRRGEVIGGLLAGPALRVDARV